MSDVRSLWDRFGYRPWARLLHRLNLHHTRTIGPLEPGGGYVEKCEWCGLTRSWGRGFAACGMTISRTEAEGKARTA